MSAEARHLLLGLLAAETSGLDRIQLSHVPQGVWRQMLRMAARQRVRPQVLRTLQARRFPHLATIRAELESEVIAIGLRNLRLQAETAAVVGLLERARIPVVLLKGAHLAHSLYGNWAAREIGDLDVLVHLSDLEPALVVLRGDGFRHSYVLPFDPAQNHHAPPLVRDGIKIEVHWTIVPPGAAPAFDPAELWTRAEAVTLGGPARLLAREDLLLHVCLHAASIHRFSSGLRPFCDIAELLRRFGPAMDWNAIAERARRWTVARGVMTSLTLAEQLVGASVPFERLSSLEPFRPSAAFAQDAVDSVFDDTGTGPERESSGVMRLAAADLGVPAKLAFAAGRWLAPDGRLLTPSAALRRAAALPRHHAGKVLRLLTDPAWRRRAARHDRLARWLSA